RALSENRDGVPVGVSVRDAEVLVEIGAQPGVPPSEVMLVAYLRHALSAIGRGENAGRTLDEFNIVRNIRTLGVWKGQVETFRVSVSSAARLAAVLLGRFFREGTLATTIPAADLVILPQDDGDNTMPSGTSATVELLARLQAATGKPDYADVVQRIVSGLASTVRDHPQVWASTLVALNRHPAPESAEAQQRTA